jgi:ATP-dependent DNA helicase RecQ
MLWVVAGKYTTVLFWRTSNWKLWNCDICKTTWIFDGTIIAQKTLSAIIRLKESEPLPVIVIFLEAPRMLYSKMNNKIKTYAIGRYILVRLESVYHSINQSEALQKLLSPKNKIRLTA